MTSQTTNQAKMEAIIRKRIRDYADVTPTAQGFSVAGSPRAIEKAERLLVPAFRHTHTDVDAEDPDYVVAFFATV